MNIMPPSKGDEVLLDSLLFNMGQILYFDFSQIDSALSRYQYVLDEYPDSKYRNQLLNIINYHNGDSLSIIKGIRDQESYTIDSLSLKRDQAWSFSDIKESLKRFNTMYEEYNDSISLFNAGYIYDQFLYDIKKALSIYYKLQDEYASHPKIEYVNNRITELDIGISTLINENNQKIDLYNAYNLIRDKKLDSAKKSFEKIEINRRDPLFKTTRELISFIDSYILMQQDYSNEQDGLKDSLIFHMAEIDYYYFNRRDDAISKFENIIKNFPNSKYVNQALWIMAKEIDKYKQDSIDYSLVDTSNISFYNPISNWDIRKIKSEYEKLNNLYGNFKDQGNDD
jgi:tetratricopeptide (TPR) repeat protein